MSLFWNRCREPFTAANILLHCNLFSLQRRRLRAALHSHGLVLNLFIDPKERQGRPGLPCAVQISTRHSDN
ncbi:hypothetical protein DPMN_033421 [Dreissena polymorpha]|uniref:Uncharacterized protein n=1 Tax=Dreissena polymorpha TaxID=45954 RepID=A0A9D4RJ52_DREPO|nr:hypothetical protein DPMN_033421 [Dreissena polymorpha]